ncbi:YdcF family protein [Microvirga pudoricolor]|uniref:YdcF family protein n=1 Tax=Microvirga pudoricolor TaxID=2778729 RepID=UPI00194FB4A2|nr:YdcF family protein [Microvirga pudoricolor]MBM6593986.1 YdcF family protein [Microvirga pudoricolor]
MSGPDGTVAAVNTLAGYLALDTFESASLEVRPADCVVLAGNSVLQTAEGAFRLVRSGQAQRVLISGGIGHSTQGLWREVVAHPAYRAIAAEGRPEAHVLADLARDVFGLATDLILLDDASTNCGENALFSRRILEASGTPMDRIVVVQDTTMQRRTDATFRHVWRDGPATTFMSWPTFTPQVCVADGALAFTSRDIAGLWPMERFLSLILGEIPRLRDDPSGYGPKGRGFIGHVEIPPEVEAAHALLLESVGPGVGDRALQPPNSQ